MIGMISMKCKIRTALNMLLYILSLPDDFSCTHNIMSHCFAPNFSNY